MANYKIDLLNKLGNKRYYLELELGRLANNITMNYEHKLKKLKKVLKKIALLNSEVQLVEHYFIEKPVEPQVSQGNEIVNQPPTEEEIIDPASPLPGQTHGE